VSDVRRVIIVNIFSLLLTTQIRNRWTRRYDRFAYDFHRTTTIDVRRKKTIMFSNTIFIRKRVTMDNYRKMLAFHSIKPISHNHLIFYYRPGGS